MGFSLKKVTKSISKAAKNVTKAASKAVSDTSNTVVKAHVDAAKALQLDKAAQVGVPIAATVLAGPAGGAVVSQATQGGSGMGFLNDVLGQDLGNIASDAIKTNLNQLLNGKPKPAPVQTITVPAPAQDSGNDMMPLYIAGGVVAVGLVLVLALKK